MSPTINLDGVAHRLERVERKADGKNDVECGNAVRPVKYFCDRVCVGVQEVEVLEDREHADVRDNAHQQKHSSAFSYSVFDKNSSRVIHCDREKQDEDVD